MTEVLWAPIMTSVLLFSFPHWEPSTKCQNNHRCLPEVQVFDFFIFFQPRHVCFFLSHSPEMPRHKRLGLSEMPSHKRLRLLSQLNATQISCNDSSTYKSMHSLRNKCGLPHLGESVTDEKRSVHVFSNTYIYISTSIKRYIHKYTVDVAYDNCTRLAMWLIACRYRFTVSCSDFVTKVGSVVLVRLCWTEICMHIDMFLNWLEKLPVTAKNENASVKPWHLHIIKHMCMCVAITYTHT